MPAIEVAAAAPQLGDIASAVAQRGDRVTLLDRGVPLAVLVRPHELRSLVETVELLSDPEVMRRIGEAEAAFHGGDVLAGTDLGQLDPDHRYARPGPQRTAGAAAPTDGPWDLAVSGPAARSFARLPMHLADLVRGLLFDRLVADPVRYGVELRGSLSRRFVVHVETELVVYRLDSVKRSVRILEILHGTGRPGERVEPGEALVSEERLRFEDAEAGVEAPVVERILSRTDLVVYAGASGDFNPMHHDDTIATAVGMPSVFGHGMFSMGLVGSAISAWVGPGRVRRFSVRFARQTWPGETLRTRVAVTGRREENGRRLVDLECSLANSEGEVKVAGEATADLS